MDNILLYEEYFNKDIHHHHWKNDKRDYVPKKNKSNMWVVSIFTEDGNDYHSDAMKREQAEELIEKIEKSGVYKGKKIDVIKLEEEGKNINFI